MYVAILGNSRVGKFLTVTMVRLTYKNPDINGFPPFEETEILDELETQLNGQLEKHAIITLGRITSNGGGALLRVKKLL